jgi:hypothetical protein
MPPFRRLPVEERVRNHGRPGTMPVMPRARVTLPAPLDGRAFTVRQAREAGLGAGRLRSADLQAPLHGLRAPADAAGLGQLPLLAAGVADLLPGDVAFSHCTAAALWGMPLPRLREHTLPLHVMRSSGRNPIDRAQVRAHRGLESRRTSSLVRGGVRLQVVEPAETWVDLGGLLDVEDLVVAGDWVARAAGSDAVLAEALARRPGVRAARRLREALRWVRTGAESAGETRARLLFCRHGLPEPEVNGRVVAADGSGFLARSDFVWRRHRGARRVPGRPPLRRLPARR